MNGEARQSAITVVIFWMIVLTIYAVFKNQIHIYAGINSLRYVVTGIVIGLFFSFGFVFLVSKNRLQTTSKTSRNGINCTVGPVPAWNKAPVQTKEKFEHRNWKPEDCKDCLQCRSYLELPEARLKIKEEK